MFARNPKNAMDSLIGPVQALELLEVQPKARIYGEVHYKVLEMHGGALVSGQLIHHDGVDKVLHLAASEA